MALPVCKSVLITGTNRGLGLEFVKQFLALPTPPELVFATCRNLEAESANELKNLAAKNGNLHLLQLDVDDYDGIKQVASQVTEKLQGKGLDILINNAAILKHQVIGEITPDAMTSMFNTNTISPIMVTQAFLPLVKQAAKDANNQSQPKAVIAFVSSGFVLTSRRQKSRPYPYVASKGALTSLVRPMQDDLEDDGITVAALDPGWVQTDMGGPKAPQTAHQSVSGLLKMFGSISENAKKGMISYEGLVPW